MGLRHYWDIVRGVFDSTYVPKQYRRPIPPAPPVPTNATPERERQAREARRRELERISREDRQYNEGVQSAAANTETGLLTTAEVGLVILSPDHGIVSAPMVEAGVNSGLRQRGDGAPARSVWQLAPGIGDDHYGAGGLPSDHPSRGAYGSGNGNTGLATPGELVNAMIVNPVRDPLGYLAGDPAGIWHTRPGQENNPQGYRVDPITGNPIVPTGTTAPSGATVAPGTAGAAPGGAYGTAPSGVPAASGGSWLERLFSGSSLIVGGIGAALGFFLGGGPIGALIGGAMGAFVGKPLVEGVMGAINGPAAPPRTTTAPVGGQLQVNTRQPVTSVPASALGSNPGVSGGVTPVGVNTQPIQFSPGPQGAVADKR